MSNIPHSFDGTVDLFQSKIAVAKQTRDKERVITDGVRPSFSSTLYRQLSGLCQVSRDAVVILGVDNGATDSSIARLREQFHDFMTLLEEVMQTNDVPWKLDDDLTNLNVNAKLKEFHEKCVDRIAVVDDEQRIQAELHAEISALV